MIMIGLLVDRLLESIESQRSAQTCPIKQDRAVDSVAF